MPGYPKNWDLKPKTPKLWQKHLIPLPLLIKDGNVKYVHDITKTQQQSEKITLKVLADEEFYDIEAEIEFSILRVELELVTPQVEIRNETEITLSENIFKIQDRV